MEVRSTVLETSLVLRIREKPIFSQLFLGLTKPKCLSPSPYVRSSHTIVAKTGWPHQIVEDHRKLTKHCSQDPPFLLDMLPTQDDEKSPSSAMTFCAILRPPPKPHAKKPQKVTRYPQRSLLPATHAIATATLLPVALALPCTNTLTEFQKPAFTVGVEEGVCQVIAIILRNFKRFVFYTLIEVLVGSETCTVVSIFCLHELSCHFLKCIKFHHRPLASIYPHPC